MNVNNLCGQTCLPLFIL